MKPNYAATSELRIVKQTGEGKKYLSHMGHSHQWTSDKTLAMVYSKIEVAQGLIAKYGGELEAA